MLSILKTEPKLFGLISANGALGAIRHFMLAHQADLNLLLTLLQIVAAVYTVWHIFKRSKNTKNDKSE